MTTTNKQAKKRIGRAISDLLKVREDYPGHFWVEINMAWSLGGIRGSFSVLVETGSNWSASTAI